IAAVGALPLSYQWRFNGNDIPGSNSPVLQLNDVQFGRAGTYSVVVSNAFGTVTNSSLTLGVAPFFISAQPQSQNSYRGATARLNVTPTGQGPFSFHWRRYSRSKRQHASAPGRPGEPVRSLFRRGAQPSGVRYK